MVAGPHRRGQPVLDPIGPLQRLRLVVEALHGDHRAEDLLLDHLVVLVEPRHDGRSEAIATVADLCPAGRDRGVRRRSLDEPAHPCELVLAVERAVVGVVLGVRADRRPLGLRHQRVDQVPVDARGGQHPGGGGAVLARVEVRRAGDAPCGRLHVGVVENDDRRLAAQFQVDPLQVRGSGSGDLHAGAHAAGDRDHRRDRVRHEGPTGVPVAADDVEDAGREVLTQDPGEQQGAHRCRVGRLEHHRVAGGKRGRPLPDGHHHRVVPGGHGGAHPDRLAPDIGGVPGHVLGRGPSFEEAGGAGEEPDLVDHRWDLFGHREAERLAGVLTLRPDQFVGTRLDRVGGAEQGHAPFGRRRPLPGAESFLGHLQSPVDVGFPGEGGPSDHVAGARVDDRRARATGHIDVLTAYEVAQFSQSHSPDLAGGEPSRPTVPAPNIAEDFPRYKGIPVSRPDSAPFSRKLEE